MNREIPRPTLEILKNSYFGEQPQNQAEAGKQMQSPERLSPENFERLGLFSLYAANEARAKLESRGADPALPEDYAFIIKSPRRLAKTLGHDHPTLESVNVYGDQPIRADAAAEAAVLNVLKDSGIRWRVRSEEHGEVFIYNGGIYENPSTNPLFAPEAFLVLDGIDGSKADQARMKEEYDSLNLPGDEQHKDGDSEELSRQAVTRLSFTPAANPKLKNRDNKERDIKHRDNEALSRRAGTMLSFAPVANPNFKDFTFAGMMEHDYGDRPDNGGRLVYATEGRGVFVQSPYETRQILPPEPGKNALKEGDTVTYLELAYFTKGKEGDALEAYLKANNISFAKLLSSGSHHIDFILGQPMPRYAILQPDRTTRFRTVLDKTDANTTDHRRNMVAVIEPERKGWEEFVVAEVFTRILNAASTKNKGVIQTITEDGAIIDVGELNYLETAARWFKSPRPPVRPVVLAYSSEVAEQLLKATREPNPSTGSALAS